MSVDVSKFHPLNVVDTCSIWNVLSSQLLYATARAAQCSFCCTDFVLYECLYRKRSRESDEDLELQNRFRKEHASRGMLSCSLDVADLQDVSVLESRRRLGKGELSSIVLAKKTRQAFLTDDRKAKKLAETELDAQTVQTTPHLFGWLFFERRLTDNDKDKIIQDHKRLRRPLSEHFEKMYVEAFRCLMMSRQKPEPADQDN